MVSSRAAGLEGQPEAMVHVGPEERRFELGHLGYPILQDDASLGKCPSSRYSPGR